jgi:hypothetical protein
LPPLVNQLADSNSTARVSAYTAVSCLVRHNTAGRQALLQATFVPVVVQSIMSYESRHVKHSSVASDILDAKLKEMLNLYLQDIDSY